MGEIKKETLQENVLHGTCETIFRIFKYAYDMNKNTVMHIKYVCMYADLPLLPEIKVLLSMG